jgi:hypothetical protein
MNNKSCLYRICLVIFLLSGATYAQEKIPPLIDFRESLGFAGVVDENGVLLRDRLRVNNVLVATEVGDPFAPNKSLWRQVPFDIIFKACSFDEGENFLFIAGYRLSETRDDFVPLFEEVPCQESRLDFSIAQAFGMEEKIHWLKIHSVYRYTEEAVEDIPHAKTSIKKHFNVAFEMNFDNPFLRLEPRWEYVISPPREIQIWLDWGEVPHDMDAHLTGPDPKARSTYNNADERFHLYFNNKENEVATLDTGEFSDTKPEKISIFPPRHNNSSKKVEKKVLREGIYRFTVHHFTGSGTIADSDAEVHLKIGERTEQLFTPPPAEIETLSDEPMDIWIVFELHVAAEGTVTVVPIQQFDCGINPSQIDNPFEIIVPTQPCVSEKKES